MLLIFFFCVKSELVVVGMRIMLVNKFIKFKLVMKKLVYVWRWLFFVRMISINILEMIFIIVVRINIMVKNIFKVCDGVFKFLFNFVLFFSFMI